MLQFRFYCPKSSKCNIVRNLRLLPGPLTDSHFSCSCCGASLLCKSNALWLRLNPEALQEPQPEPKLYLKVSAEGVLNPSSHLAAACLLRMV